MKNNDPFSAFAKCKTAPTGAVNHKAVIYTRVSTKEQAENNASLDTQLKYCQTYALQKGLQVVQYFGGTHESAKSDERKEFQKMLQYVKRHKIGNIVVFSYDRFSRTGTHAAYLTEQLKKKGTLILSATQDVDTTTTAGVFQQDLYYAFSRMDNDIRREKSVTGMREKLLRGEWVGTVPFGYTNLNPGKGKKQQIVVNEEGELLRKAFYWKANDNLTYDEITQRLKKYGWNKPPKKLGYYFRNPFYAGKVTSKHLDGQIVNGNHEPLVPEKIWLKVNDILNERANGYAYKRDQEELPLKQFVKADSCGTPYTGYLVKKKGLYYYKNNRRGSKENRSAKKMHEEFLILLTQYQLTEKAYIPPFREIIYHTIVAQQEDRLNNAHLMERRLNELTRKAEAVEERYVTGEIDRDLFDKYRGKFDTEILQLEEELNRDGLDLSNLENAVDLALQYSVNLPDLWASSDLDTKRSIQWAVFPEGVRYDFANTTYRTPRVNGLFFPIPQLIKAFEENKNGTNQKFDGLSHSVLGAGISSF